jgi:methionine sulfoxide reductase heme-binding subunit
VRKETWLKLGVHVASLTPLATLVWAVWHGQLGPDLIGAATRRTGRYALAWLLLSLAPTAVRVLSGWPGMLRIRRLLGLYALFYALVHFSIFLGLTYAFDLSLALEGVRQSRFILLGGAALLILVSLGITSTSGWMRRLRRNWKRLHRLVYLAAALAALHYLWNFKDTRKTPLLVGGVLVVLLIVRLPPVERLLARLRRSPGDRRSTEQPRSP